MAAPNMLAPEGAAAGIIAQTVVTTGPAVASVMTAGSDVTVHLDNATLYNTSGSAADVTVHVVPAGASAADASTAVGKFTCNPGIYVSVRDLLAGFYSDGDMIAMIATAGSINFTATGTTYN